MLVYGVVIGLFILALAAPWVCPNKKISNHKKDWDLD